MWRAGMLQCWKDGAPTPTCSHLPTCLPAFAGAPASASQPRQHKPAPRLRLVESRARGFLLLGLSSHRRAPLPKRPVQNPQRGAAQRALAFAWLGLAWLSLGAMGHAALAALPRLAEPVILLVLGHQLSRSGLFKPSDGEVGAAHMRRLARCLGARRGTHSALYHRHPRRRRHRDRRRPSSWA
jgi:hypothetical protein